MTAPYSIRVCVWESVCVWIGTSHLFHIQITVEDKVIIHRSKQLIRPKMCRQGCTQAVVKQALHPRCAMPTSHCQSLQLCLFLSGFFGTDSSAPTRLSKHSTCFWFSKLHRQVLLKCFSQLWWSIFLTSPFTREPIH